MIRRSRPQDWLARDTLLSFFGRTTKRATKNYIQLVNASDKSPDIWSNLRHRLFLGDDSFVERTLSQCEMIDDLSEIPRLQKRGLAKPLGYFLATYPDRNVAMCAACKTGYYSLSDIAHFFGVHYNLWSPQSSEPALLSNR